MSGELVFSIETTEHRRFKKTIWAYAIETENSQERYGGIQYLTGDEFGKRGNAPKIFGSMYLFI
jgi:hypothetical protein